MNLQILSRFKIILICFFLVFIFSCKRKKLKILSPYDERKSVVDPDLLVQAKHSDISVPVGYKLVSLQSKLEDNSDYAEQLSFVGKMDSNQVVNFYKKNMELSGWQILDFSGHQEGMLFCDKLNKSCLVSIRKISSNKKNYKTKLLLFIKNKKDSSYNNQEVDINSKVLPRA